MKYLFAALLALAPFSASADEGQTHLYLNLCPGFTVPIRANAKPIAVAKVKRIPETVYPISHDDACSALEFTSDEPSIATLPSVFEEHFSVSVAALGRGRVSIENSPSTGAARETVAIPPGLKCWIAASAGNYHLLNCQSVAEGAR
jgi:hypothetical protein